MEPLLKLEHLSKQFTLGRKRFYAVEDLSLDILKGEVLGLVGESGSGKSTLARMIMGVYPPTSGGILYQGKPVRLRSARERAAFAGHAQMVFQDPYTSLDPRMTAEAAISEGLEIHGTLNAAARRERVCALLELVGLSREHAGRFPHEFSGGQCQRLCIARALAVEPEFLVCDEPISALDTSIQSQVVNLLKRLRRERGLTYLFIGHDLNMVRYLSDRIAVMYLGHLVELGEADALCSNPHHPYTQMLLDAVLRPDPTHRLLDGAGAANGEGPRTRPDKGCPFAPRCPLAQARCHTEFPTLTQRAAGHFTACHLN